MATAAKREKVLTPVCCNELTDLTKTPGKTDMQADRERALILTLHPHKDAGTLTDGESKSFVGQCIRYKRALSHNVAAGACWSETPQLSLSFLRL